MFFQRAQKASAEALSGKFSVLLVLGQNRLTNILGSTRLCLGWLPLEKVLRLEKTDKLVEGRVQAARAAVPEIGGGGHLI